jgi:hypothetical protein
VLTVNGIINVVAGGNAATTTDVSDVNKKVWTDNTGKLTNPVLSAAKSGSGLYLGHSEMGFYNGSTWKTYMDSSGNFYLNGAGTGNLLWSASTNVLTISGTIHASSGKIGNVNIGSSKVYTGTGNWGNSDTGFYFDDTGQFSLKDKLTWNGTTLNVKGNLLGGNLTGYDTPTNSSGWYFGSDGTATIGTAGGSNNRLLWTGSQLQVYGGVYIMDTVGIRNGGSSTLTITGGSNNGVDSGAQIDLVPYSGTGHAQIQASSKAGADIYFRTGDAGGSPKQGYIRAIIHDDGLFEVYDAGVGANAGDLSVANDATADSWTTRSSKRWKDNITPITNAFELVNKLNGVRFDWNNRDLKNDIGLIAEEVENVLPTLVRKEKDEIIGVDYSRITALLIEAIKELNQKIDKLSK